MIAPELLARFPPGTTAEDGARYLAAAGGNLSEAIEMCHAGSTAAAPRPGGSSSSSSHPPVSKQRRVPGSTNYFVGGGDSSGQAVVAPLPPQRGRGTADSVEDSIENVFAKARENGARESTGEFGSDQGVAFAGTGRRLGHLEGPSPVMQATRRLKKNIKITFYQDGFQVEDGPLRLFTDEAGARFLESINRGFIPRELVADFGDVDINVDLVDRREEPYAPPPLPAYVAFGGSGRTLGGESSAQLPPPPPSQNNTSVVSTTADDVFVNEAEETCKLAIMTLSGKRCEIVVNPLRHTVRDLRVLASRLVDAPFPSIQSFSLLVRDVPPRTLADDTVTLDAAKCRNATIMMKKL